MTISGWTSLEKGMETPSTTHDANGTLSMTISSAIDTSIILTLQ